MSKKQIIVVEDEPDILDVLNYNLQREGFEVRTCENGADSLELIFRVMPDLILLDLMLPGMEGAAKIVAADASPIWIATHRLGDFLRLALWW